MKNAAYLGLLCLCLACVIMPLSAKANSAAAGEIIYEWLSDSTYRFYFKLYRDCAGSAAPDSMPLCFYDPCNNALSFTTQLYKTPASAAKVPYGCSKLKTQCDSPASIIPEYKLWTYTRIATLPGRCNSWRIYTYMANRNASVNIINPTTKPFYLETRFNNMGSNKTNSSPYFSLGPISYVYKNESFLVNNGAIDPDGDSLVTEVVPSLTNVTNCGDTVPANVTYVTSSPAIGTVHNPFQTNNTFTLDSSNGKITFSSASAGRNTYAIRVKEYRGGVLIGSTMREAQVQLFPSTPDTPIFTPGPGLTSGYYDACVGVPFSFYWDIVSPDKNAILGALAPGTPFSPVTVNFSGLGTDSIRAAITWTPGMTDTGAKNIVLVAVDSTCKAPGRLWFYFNNFQVKVHGLASNLKDTSICPGDTASYSLASNGSYTWSIMPGGTANSISCLNCNTPRMYPITTTRYIVNGNFSPVCPLYPDTVQVSIKTNMSYAAIKITVSPDTNIFIGTTVRFIANKINCTHSVCHWKLNGTDIPGAVADTFMSSMINDLDIVTCELICNDTCPRPKDTMSNAITMHVSTGIRDIKPGNISIYPNPNNGTFTIKAHEPGKTSCEVQVVNTIGQTIYSKTAPVIDSELNETLKLEVPPGVYLLRVNEEPSRFTVTGQ